MIDSYWSGYLGGAAFRREASRRILAVTIAGTLLVVAVASVQRWPLRPMLATLLIVQASQIIARIYLAHEAAVSVVVAGAGLALVRRREALWFAPWESISTARGDGPDVCIVTTDGGIVRIGLDTARDNETALRAILTAVARHQTRR